jgi:hypothetical protein
VKIHYTPLTQVPTITRQQKWDQRQLMAIFSQINQQREHSVSMEPNELTLPRFIPEIAYADPVAWCSTVSLFMERRPIQSDELFFTLSRVLEDTASH